jgi:hypothetical protein
MMNTMTVRSRTLRLAAAVVALASASWLVPGIATASDEVAELRGQLEALQQRLDELEKGPREASGSAAVQVSGQQQGGTQHSPQASQAPSRASASDTGAVKDQSGNNPRDFTSKFMPYYRFTELENDLQAQELTLFGFLAFNKRFGMTY